MKIEWSLSGKGFAYGRRSRPQKAKEVPPSVDDHESTTEEVVAQETPEVSDNDFEVKGAAWWP